jgi:hypothetical protein
MVAVMDTIVIHATPGATIACDMTTAADSPEERLAEYGHLYAHALVARDRTDDALVLTFAAKPGVWEWIADLVRREAVCCPFFSYQVERRENEIVWTTRAGASPAALDAVEAMLDEFYAEPDRFDDGFDGLLAQLAGKGVNLVREEPGRLTMES